MSLVTWTIFLITFAWLILEIFRRFWKLHKLNIPVRNEYPLIIEIFYPMMKLAIMSAQERFELLTEYSFKYPDIIKGWFWPGIVIVVNSPDKVQKVLMSQKCLEKWSLFYDLMGREFGLIAASTKRKWKEHRKFFNFSFSSKILESFTQVFIDQSKVLCKNLENEAESGKEFDFSVYAKRSSFDVLCATSLGMSIDDLKNDKNYENIFEAHEM